MDYGRRRLLVAGAGTALGLLAGVGAVERRSTTARAQAIAGAPTFRGVAGKSVVGPVVLTAAVTVLRAQHNGTGNFTVTLFVPADGETPQQSFDLADYSDSSLVFDLIGSVRPAGAALATIAADHYLQVTATGAWQVSVEQPYPEILTPKTLTTFSGKGQDVSPYFMLPDGITRANLQTSSNSLRAWLYHLDDLGGETVPGDVPSPDGRLYDLSFPGGSKATSAPVPDAGPYVLAVNNTAANTDAWTISFS